MNGLREITLYIEDFKIDCIDQSSFFEVLYDMGFEFPEVKKTHKIVMLVSRVNVNLFDENGEEIIFGRRRQIAKFKNNQESNHAKKAIATAGQ